MITRHDCDDWRWSQTTRPACRRPGSLDQPPAVQRPDGGELVVTAVPAVHGPEDGERDAEGFVNCEVIGFILSSGDLPTVYVSGDNASIGTVVDIAHGAWHGMRWRFRLAPLVSRTSSATVP